MNVRRALLAASTTALLAVPATAPAQEVIRCGPTFLLGPVECKVEQTQQTLADSPPVQCQVTFLLGPVQCKVEREWRNAFDPDNS
jgi:hypothetical protein